MDCCVAETESLTKKYGDKTAVENVSLHVRKGDIYGLIGKNGAGKTTLMKLLLGLTIPDSGDIVLFGSKDAESSRKRIGSLIEAPALYKNETAFENMRRFSFLTQSSGEYCGLWVLEKRERKKPANFHSVCANDSALQ